MHLGAAEARNVGTCGRLLGQGPAASQGRQLLRRLGRPQVTRPVVLDRAYAANSRANWR